MNMTAWIKGLPASGKPLPILSFPAASLTGASVYGLTHNADLQAEAIIRVASEVDSAAAVTLMDLSVEAEAFGATLSTSEDEVPTVLGALLSAEDGVEGVEALSVPKIGAGRTALYLEAAQKAKAAIHDRPVLAGTIGPFSLAGRLMEVSEALVNCLCEEDFMHAVLRRTTDFLLAYAGAYKAAGLDGIVMAEPLSGLLSPELEAVFSSVYVKEIVEALQDESFAVIYHNCGPNTPMMIESLVHIGAAAYHVGDAIELDAFLSGMPRDIPVLGNISPTAFFLHGTPQSIYDATLALCKRVKQYGNFVLSSGCDIPPKASWANIRAFFKAAADAEEGRV